MENSLSIRFFGPDNNRPYDEGLFKQIAEEDYLIGRYLAIVGFRYMNNALFHFQQSMEKYLKAFLIRNSYTGRFDGTHDLEILASYCAQYDTLFDDANLRRACTLITPFEEKGRYQPR